MEKHETIIFLVLISLLMFFSGYVIGNANGKKSAYVDVLQMQKELNENLQRIYNNVVEYYEPTKLCTREMADKGECYLLEFNASDIHTKSVEDFTLTPFNQN